jgi:hypothetical protein
VIKVFTRLTSASDFLVTGWSMYLESKKHFKEQSVMETTIATDIKVRNGERKITSSAKESNAERIHHCIQ